MHFKKGLPGACFLRHGFFNWGLLLLKKAHCLPFQFPCMHGITALAAKYLELPKKVINLLYRQSKCL